MAALPRRSTAQHGAEQSSTRFDGIELVEYIDAMAQ
jgi:hypothetical protein